jgi:hypothetical protein
VTVPRSVPSDVDAERLSDLLDDARAIPAAAFSQPKRARTVLSLLPRQRATVRIPDATVSLVEAADDELGCRH